MASSWESAASRLLVRGGLSVQLCYPLRIMTLCSLSCQALCSHACHACIISADMKLIGVQVSNVNDDSQVITVRTVIICRFARRCYAPGRCVWAAEIYKVVITVLRL